MLTHPYFIPKGFFIAILPLEGRSASIAYPFGQVDWVNQTVLLS